MSARIPRLSPSARTCVFVKQSPGPAHCGPPRLQSPGPSPQRAPLLPKLRGHFAEFLNEGSPVRLKVLTPAHQCRFAVRSTSGLPAWLFLAPRAQPDRLWVAPPALIRLSALRPTSLDAVAPSPRQACLDASPDSSTPKHRYGNINPLSIAYGYYALGLGPTNPTRIHLPSETLGFRRTRFSRALTLLIPAFALLVAPVDLTVTPSSPQNAPLPSRPPLGTAAQREPTATASVASLSPDGLSAQDHSTSELLRTLSRVAASKPTSWLSE